MQGVFASVMFEPELDTPMLRTFIDQVIGAYGSSGDFLREDIHPEESKPDCIDHAALALPILPKDVVLTRNEVELGLVERPEIIES